MKGKMGKKILKISTVSLSIFILIMGVLLSKNEIIQLVNSKDSKLAYTTGTVSEFKEIAAGTSHSIAIDIEGNLWTWGNNTYGQLGNGSTVESSEPIQIMSGNKFKEVSAGNGYSMAIDEEGNLWAWGYNNYGQLGNGSTTDSHIPIKIKPESKFIKVSAGTNHTIAIENSGKLYAWGYNNSGQLGNGEYGNNKYSNIPIQIKEETTFKEVATGDMHSMAIDNKGNLWTWGSNGSGQLGNETTTSSYTPIQIKIGTIFKKISAGSRHSIAIDTSGNLWTWGQTYYGDSGYGLTSSKTPIQIKSGTRFKEISAGGQHNIAIDNSGNLWAWGSNAEGQLGNSTSISEKEPIQIMTENKFAKISAGDNHTIVIDSNGKLYTWGNNSYSQLGYENMNKICEPMQIKPEMKFTQVAAGHNSSMAIDSEGYLWTWGENDDGELGNERYTKKDVISKIKEDTKFQKISMAIPSTAIDINGNLWTWGLNWHGQLGNGEYGTGKFSKTPKKIKSNIKEVATGDGYTLAIDTSGNIWAWGDNEGGILGNGVTGNVEWSTYADGSIHYVQTVPIQITSGTKFSKVVAGESRSMAIDEGGTLWTWGVPLLGDGTTNKSTVPIKIKTDTKFKEIATGLNTCMAIDINGTLWTWGNDTDGYSNVPKKIKEDTKFVKIAAGENSKAAIDSEGNLWTWGFNHNGQLGNGTTTNSKEPIQIKTGTKFKEISMASRGEHILAIDEDGNLWGWGKNSNWQIIHKGATPTNIVINNTYKVELNTNGGTINSGNITTYKYSKGAKLPINVTKEGYVFAGWYNNVELTGTPITEIGAEETEDKQYYAKWIENTQISEVIKIAASENHSIIIDKNGSIWACGNNDFGQLGNGTNTSTNKLIQIKPETKFKDIAAGTFHSMALDESGNLWTWGDNRWSQLGNGTSSDSTVPIQIKSGTKFIEISAGNGHSMAIDEEGNLWTWGLNYNGQLGNGTSTDSAEPIQVKSGTKFTKISAGNDYSIAIDSERNLWAWGNNEFGQLGDKSTTTRKSPVQIKSGTKFIEVSAGNGNTIAIDSNKRLWTWGYNSYGQLGDETEENKLEGIQIMPEKEFITISAGNGHSMAIDNSNILWAWGLNESGQLGDETTTNSNKPIAIKDQTAFTQISAGNGYSMAIDNVNNLWAWGLNYDGQLGNGSNEDVTTPGQIEVESKCKVIFKDGEKELKTELVNIGESATAPEITKEGYTLKWDKEFTNITESITINAIWTPNTDTPYKVEHYKQKVTKDGYELAETENKKGTTDETATAIVKEYEGFIENTEHEGRIETGKIEPNGSLVLKLYYDRKTYNVSINIPGQEEGKEYTYGEEVTLPTDVKREGYTFGGWYDNEEFTGDPITKIIINEETANKEYYIKWIPNVYKVTLHPNEGTINSGNVTEYTYAEGATLPTDVTRLGYTFAGWYDNEQLEGTPVTEITSTDLENKQFYAKWTANGDTAYKVEHYKQKVTKDGYELAEIENKTGTTDENATATAKEYEGFIENTEHEGRIETGKIEPNGSLVLKLYYDRKTYNVSINIPGQEEGKEYTYGEEVTLPTNVEKEGYTFGGWYDNEEFTGDPITKIIINEETANKEYYIKWIPNTDTPYKVEHYKQNLTKDSYELAETENKTGTTDETARAIVKEYEGFIENTEYEGRIETGKIEPNGSLVLKLYYDRKTYNVSINIPGQEEGKEYTYGEEVTLPTNVEKEGYTFGGWYDNEEFTGDPITKIIINEETANKEYHIKWIPNVYKVTLHPNEGTINSGNVTEYTYAEGATLPTDVTKQGYTFAGWYDNENLEGNAILEIGKTDIEDKSFYARWIANGDTQYKVEHYKQNITKDGYELAETENKTGTTNETATAIFKEYEGFIENTEYEGRVLTGTIKADGSLILKLYYDRKTYNVSINIPGQPGEKEYTYGEEITLPTDITRPGYTFGGWYDNEEFTGDSITKIIVNEETANKEYYIKWIPNTDTPYKVEHYKQNLTKDSYELAETENRIGTTDESIIAVAKQYEGFIENTEYEGRVSEGTISANGSLVLKLYYDRKTYNVSINIPGQEEGKEYTYGEEVTLPTDVEREGYTFGGWYDNEEFTGDPITKIIINEETANKEYYIKWIPNVYKVTLHPNEGTINSGNVTEYTYAEGVTLPTDVTKQGYTFAGWYDNENLEGNAILEIVKTDIEDKAFYAKWIANGDTQYKVEHYKQNITKDGYELAETENKTGVTNETATAIFKEYEGFIENTEYEGRVLTGTIKADGSLILKLYYDRKTYNVNINIPGQPEGKEYVYGEEITLPTDITRPGYTFGGWYDNEEFTGDPIIKIIVNEETANKEYHIKWIANTNTPYKIEYYVRNLDTEVEGYDLFETENKTGTTDTNVIAIAKEYEGFTENTEHAERIVSGNINGDGSLVLKLYYNRNIYNITYKLNEGTADIPLTNTYTYGKEFILSNKVSKQGCVFLGWYNNEALEGNPVTSIGNTETGDKTFYAKWSVEEEYYITSKVYNINTEENYITKVSPETSVSKLINNVQINGTPKVINLKGKEVSGEELVGTGYKLQVTFKGKTNEYEIAVRGDLDGNGTITITDLSILNQTLVNTITLTGIKEKAADLDYRGGITITDLSVMNQALVGKVKL